MIGDSVFEVFLIRGSVLALRAITPLSFLYGFGLVGVATIRNWRPSLAFRIPAYYALAEILFSVFIYYPHKRVVETETFDPPSLERPAREQLLTKCLSAIDDPEDFFRGWFRGAPLQDIRRENIREWVTWALLSSDMAQTIEPDEWMAETDTYIAQIERATGLSFAPGKTDVTPMRLQVDEVHVVSRPLFWYILVACCDGFTHLALSFFGLTYYTTSRWFETFPYRPLTLSSRHHSPTNDISYWYRPHTAVDKDPIVLIHGIGIGLLAYIQLIRDIITADPSVGIIAVEVLPISMRILPNSRPGSEPHAFIANLETILEYHSIDTFTLVGHSYGTFLSAHILRHAPRLAPRVRSLVLLDPITFLLFHPFLVHNFVYRVPGRWMANEWMLWYFTSRDIGIATMIARRFFWSDGVLWKDELDTCGEDVDTSPEAGRRKVLVVLGGRDQIIDGWKVWKYLTTPGPPTTATSTTLSRSTSSPTSPPITLSPTQPSLHLQALEADPDEIDILDDKHGGTLVWEKEDTLKVVLNTQLDHAQILVISPKRSVIIDRLVESRFLEA